MNCYRKIGLTFSGSLDPIIIFDRNGYNGKDVYMRLENGEYRNGKEIITRHPNIVFGIIKGKKSWGLHVKMWSEGIGEGSFTISEILEDFFKKKVEIPECYLKEFVNSINNILK